MAYNCWVIVREVWDTRDLAGRVLDEDGRVREGALATRFEPEDLNALEMALRIKDGHGGRVTAISIGAPRGVDVLRECLYRGADDALRIDADPRVLDTQAVARLLAAAIAGRGPYDLVLAGVSVVEGETSLLGSHVAALLGIEQISYVDALVAIGDGRVVGRRAIEMGTEDIETRLPALLSVGVALKEDDPRTPRSAKAMLKLKAKKTEIPEVRPAALGIEGDPATLRTTTAGGLAPVEERVVQPRDVDAEDEAALKAMLDDVLKGA
jgi:electron transfer flavoprotein beta subunit